MLSNAWGGVDGTHVRSWRISFTDPRIARRRILVARRAGRGEGFPLSPRWRVQRRAKTPLSPHPRLFLRHLHLLGRFCRLRARRRAVCSSSFRQCAVRRRSRTTCSPLTGPVARLSTFLLPFARLLLHLLTLPPSSPPPPPPPPLLLITPTDRIQKNYIRDRLVSSRPVVSTDDSLSLSHARERGRGREVARTCRIPFLTRDGEMDEASWIVRLVVFDVGRV